MKRLEFLYESKNTAAFGYGTPKHPMPYGLPHLPFTQLAKECYRARKKALEYTFRCKVSLLVRHDFLFKGFIQFFAVGVTNVPTPY